MRLLPCGDRAVVAEFGDAVDPAINARVRAFAYSLQQMSHGGVLQVTPTYRSALVEYDPLTLDWDTLTALLHEADRRTTTLRLPAPRRVRVPVCYGGEFGPDLESVCEHTGLSQDQVIARHAGAEYLVYCVGFAAGFPYMGGLDPALVTPRLPAPRTKVPAGAVGIGGQQTGVYPMELPGGWRLIGRSPMRLFDAGRQEPCLLQSGDLVTFVPIDAAEYERVAAAVATGGYAVERA